MLSGLERVFVRKKRRISCCIDSGSLTHVQSDKRGCNECAYIMENSESYGSVKENTRSKTDNVWKRDTKKGLCRKMGNVDGLTG